MICNCGFKFSGAGEIRNCPAFITSDGESGIVCPVCKKEYVNIRGEWIYVKKP